MIGPDGAFAAGPQMFLLELAVFSGAVVLDAIALMRRASKEKGERNAASYPPSVAEFARFCQQADKRLKMLAFRPADDGGGYLSKEENLKRLQGMCERLEL